MNIQIKLPQLEDLHGVGKVPTLENEGDIFDLNSVVRIFRMRRNTIISTAIIVVSLTAAILFQLTPLYTATSLVMLDQRKNNIVDVGAVLSGLATDPSSLENQVNILQSRNLAARVIDNIHLDQDAEFDPPVQAQPASYLPAWIKPSYLPAWIKPSYLPAWIRPSYLPAWINPSRWFGAAPVLTQGDDEEADRKRNAIINRFEKRLSAVALGRSASIEIRFQSENAAKAAKIADAIADAYIEDQLSVKYDAAQKATQWLSDRVQQLAEQQRNADSAIQQYKVQYNITEAKSGDSINEQQLTELNAQVILARSNLAEQEAKLSSVIELERTGRSAEATSVVGSQLIRDLRQQETELSRKVAELSSRYGPKHPRMIEVVSERKDLEAKIQQEINRTVQTTRNEVTVARARMNSLEQGLAQLRRNSTVENKARISLRALEANAASTRSMYEAFLQRFNETVGQEAVQAPDARVVSRASIPASPNYPNKALVLGAVLSGGLILGFLLAALMEGLGTGFRTPAQVENFLGLPVLAAVPEISGIGHSSRRNAARVIDKPLSAFSESIRGLQMGLALSNVDERPKPKVVLITSAIPGEGKTTLAVNLARLAARTGQKVIIVESDMRWPSVARSLGISRRKNKSGIVEFLKGQATLEECLVKDPRSELWCLPITNAPRNPADIFNSTLMQKLVTCLRGEFDLVIIDSAPLLPVQDAKILSHHVDAIVLAIQWDKTPRDASLGALRALNDIKPSIAGVALTRANFKRFQYYSYGYKGYYHYNKYYTN